jgi:copper transport protein
VLGRFLTVASAALIGMAVLPSMAAAHAALVKTDPPTLCLPEAIPRISPDDPRCVWGILLSETPRNVRFVFNEPVELVGRGVRVFAPSGRRADRGAPRMTRNEVTMDIGGSEAGTYLVLWRVVSDDTHPSSGAFVFSVNHTSSPPGGVPRAADTRTQSILGLALQAIARAVHFAGFALGFGTIVFRWTVLAPPAIGEAVEDPLVWRLVNTGVLLLVAAEPLALLAQASSLGEGVGGVLDPDVVNGVLESSFGRILLQRLGAAGLLWILIGALQNSPSRAGPLSVAVALTALALAFVDGEAAHAASTPVPWLGLGVNALHVLAMGAWVGGVAALIGVWRQPALEGRRGEIAVRARRLAVMSLIILASSGTLLAMQHLTGAKDLLLTAYGRTLMVKVSVLLAALLLAVAAARATPPHSEKWWRREAATLLGILVLAGLLVSLRPPV